MYSLGKMRTSRRQKASEKIVRSITIGIQVLGIIGGALLIGLLAPDIIAYTIGGLIVAVSGPVPVYEIIMIALSFVEQINHSKRLSVDFRICSVMGCLYVLATLVFLILWVIVTAEFGWLGLQFVSSYGIFPLVFGILSSTIFIVSAVSSRTIRSKIRNQSRRGQITQPAPPAGDSEAPTLTTFVMVQQPITSHPTQSAVEGGAAGCPPPDYYSVVGEGGTPQYYAHPAAGPARVGGDGKSLGEPYYSQPLPHSTTISNKESSELYGDSPPSYASIAT